MAVKRAIQDVLDHSPRLQALTPPKTREVVQWCRQRGYTPPDLEPQRRNDDESIEDILTQIDSEPGELARRLRCRASQNRKNPLGLCFAACSFAAVDQCGSIFSFKRFLYVGVIVPVQ